MNYKQKKRLTYVTIAFYFICGGIEYAVIFPTIWSYLQFLGAKSENLLGLSVAAFSLSSMLVSPIVGKWYDKTRNAKQILILMNVFEITGGVLYFLAPYPWFVVLSRFICGLGGCAGTAVMADITQSSEIEDRTAIVSCFQACRQIGLLFGPVFNLLLREINFNLGHFPVNQLTAPGIFMALLGVILEILFVTLYFNLDENETHQKLVESLRYDYNSTDTDEQWVGEQHRRPGGSQPSVNSEPELEPDSEYEYLVYPVTCISVARGACRHCRSRRDLVLSRSGGSDHMMEDAEKFMGAVVCQLPGCSHSRPRSAASGHGWSSGDSSRLTEDNYLTSGRSEYVCVNSAELENNVIGCRGLLWNCSEEFLRDEVVVLLGLSFISFFAQTVLETIVTPLSQRFYNFGEYENSLLFLFAGIETMLSFLSINFLSRKLQDRTLILAGSILMIFSLTWYLIFVPGFHYGDWNSLPYFIVGIFTNLLGISLLIACCISLFSKLISKERQGLGHGIRRTMLSAGMILGPLWGGATTNMLVVLFSIPLALVILFSALFCGSFNKLIAPVVTLNRAQFTSNNSRSYFESDEERRPLLSESS